MCRKTSGFQTLSCTLPPLGVDEKRFSEHCAKDFKVVPYNDFNSVETNNRRHIRDLLH